MESEITTVLVITAIVLTFYGMWKVFEKAGESGWKAIVPVYNLYTLAKISGNSGWWFVTFFLFLSPSVPYWIEPSEFTVQDYGLGDDIFEIRGVLFNDGLGGEIWLELSFVVSAMFLVFFWSSLIKIMYDLSYLFGRGLLFSLGLIFLPFIFFPILGLSENRYQNLARVGNDRGDLSIDNNSSAFGKYISLTILVVWLSLNSIGIFGDIFLSTDGISTVELASLSGVSVLSILLLYLFQIKDLTHSHQE